MEFRCILIDDEPAARRNIARMLAEHHPDLQVIGVAGSVSEGKALLEEVSPDLLFLDVQMEDGTGFDLLDVLPPVSFSIIFTTAHDGFAVRAFRYNAIDYLLKPIDPKELSDAIQRAQAVTDYKVLQQQLTQLKKTAAEKNFEHIVLNTSNGTVFTQTQEILRIETYGNYVFVFLMNGERHLVSRNLKEFEEMLPEPDFFRLHQSHIINTGHVKQFLKGDGGFVMLKDGNKIPVSRRRKNALIEVLTRLKLIA